MTEPIKLFEVGGAIRDELLGVRSKDVDFAVVASSFEAMERHIEAMGLRIFISKPEFVTIRAGVPKDHPLRERCKDADFVLARKDGPSTDGRRPDFVEPGTIEDDLRRRDFTVNAIARDPFTGEFIDPHNGRADLEQRTLRFVGRPMDRIREDGLRVLRGFRFHITKGLSFDAETERALVNTESCEMLSAVSVERIREEVEKMVAHDTIATLKLLGELPRRFHLAIFREGLRLSATLKGK